MPVTIESPYLASPGPLWLKGNLHTHTTRSDGVFTPQEIIDTYSKLGYDFLAFSDHNVVSDYSDLDPRGMVLIPGNEISTEGPHLLAVGAGVAVAPGSAMQSAIDAVNSAGGLAVLCHPNWERRFNHYTYEQMCALTGYAGIEVFNGCIVRLRGRAVSSDKWERLLDAGRRSWGLAVDDVHRAEDVGRGWCVVQAAERTEAAIIDGLRWGSFYASSGVTIEEISVDGSQLTVTAPDAEAIAVIGECGKRIAWVEDSRLVFDASECEGEYVRVECYGRADRMAWTQPFGIVREETEQPDAT